MKTATLPKPFTGSSIVVCAEWNHLFFPGQQELIGILHAHQDYSGYDFEKCITTSVILDKDSGYIYYDVNPKNKRTREFKVQDPEFYQWHKVKAFLKSDVEGGFHPNEITTGEGQLKVIRRYFTDNCILIARSHYGSIRNIRHEIKDLADGSFLMTIEYEAKFEGAFKGFFE